MYYRQDKGRKEGKKEGCVCVGGGGGGGSLLDCTYGHNVYK